MVAFLLAIYYDKYEKMFNKINNQMETQQMNEQRSIQLDNRKIKYIVNRRKRKTIGISITIDEGLKIATPLHLTERQIQEVIQKKASWILKKLDALEKLDTTKKEYENGEKFLYLGKEYILNKIKISDMVMPRIDIEDTHIMIYGSSDTLAQKNMMKKIIISWYIEQANHILPERMKLLCEKTKIYPEKVRIKDQRSRFGSCSTKRNINLNWRLIMAPMEVLDYVIVHELCHLNEMNHSKAFWALVESIVPEYKKHREWLKKNGARLVNDHRI